MPAVVVEPISVGLQFGFLAVLYLFLLWVSRSALKDLRNPPRRSQKSPQALICGFIGWLARRRANIPNFKAGRWRTRV